MMKLTDKRVEEILSEAVGADVLKIVRFLKGKRDVSEFNVSLKLKMDIQEVRNILYRLHNNNLVAYKRKKDNKKGWYVSYWTFNKSRVKELLKKINTEKLEKFRERLNVESRNLNSFFMCPKTCTRMDFHNAINYNFRCPECGSLMQQQDNVKTISFLKEKIREIEAVA
jgi:transcription initiation factor TFIIE subunit alpha